MSVTTQHPEYIDIFSQWELVEDSFKGEDAIKAKTTRYLPATSGMIDDGALKMNTDGWYAYQAYLTRALYPDVFRAAVRTMIGVMHRKPARYELPPKLESYIERLTNEGEGIAAFHRRLNEAQLVNGRMGMMLDLSPNPADNGPGVLPYVVSYNAAQMINWDAGMRGAPTLKNLNLMVLDETGNKRKGFVWDIVQRHLVLSLGDFDENEAIGGGNYRVTVYDEGGSPSETITPIFRGKPLNFIPFVVCNSGDTLVSPSEPPLLGLAKLALAIYRAEADYRQNLFMQAQDTLFTYGETEPDRRWKLGPGAANNIANYQARAEFIGVSGNGLGEQRMGLENDKKLASVMSGQLVDTTSRSRESGDALKTRVGAQTATLTQVAIAGGEALEDILKMAAIWVGEDPDKVKVIPNLQFSDGVVTPRALVEFVTAKAMGLPISLESIHLWMKEQGFTEKDFEEEMAKIETEGPMEMQVPPDPTPTEGQQENMDRQDDPARANSTNANR